MKRVLGILVGILAMMTFVPNAVHADYPPGSATVSTSDGNPPPGGPLTLSAAGFCAGANVTFSINGTIVGTAIAGADGKASIVTTAPTTPGTFTVVASTDFKTCPLTAQASLSVALPAVNLPVTGTDSSTGLRIGGLALLLGVGLVTVAATRRRTATVSK